MISIPEPCNEDFSKMTPTQRGAFCSKCKIDTFDFRNLSDLNINKLLLENKGEHLCGQFTNTQLLSLNRGFENWKNLKTKTFKSKFVFALLFVFGLSLFSCNQQEGKAIVELQKMELLPTEIGRINIESIDYINTIKNLHLLDLTDFLEDVQLDIPCELRGDLAIEQDELAGEPIFIEEDRAGGLVAVDYWDYIKDTIQSPSNNTDMENDNNSISTIFKTKAYPNPTIDNTILEIEIHLSGQFDIQVYDMVGRHIQKVYSGNLDEGKKTFPIDLENQKSGLYIINILSQGQNETVKIKKIE